VNLVLMTGKSATRRDLGRRRDFPPKKEGHIKKKEGLVDDVTSVDFNEQESSEASAEKRAQPFPKRKRIFGGGGGEWGK